VEVIYSTQFVIELFYLGFFHVQFKIECTARCALDAENIEYQFDMIFFFTTNCSYGRSAMNIFIPVPYLPPLEL
jgi:hypothetical protein